MKGITVLTPTSPPVVMKNGNPGSLTEQRFGFA